MRAGLDYPRRILYSIVASLAALGCDSSSEPTPKAVLFVHGQILSAGPAPVGLSGATVVLREGFPSEEKRVAEVTTDQTGNYQLTYEVRNSFCELLEATTYWIEGSAQGYETASTFPETETGAFSDPLILCTNEPQEINLLLQALGSLQVNTRTTGSELDPDGYALLQGGFPDSGGWP